MLIENQVKEQQVLFAALEPEKRGYKKEKEAIFVAPLPTLLRTVESIRTWIHDNQSWYWVPKLEKIA